MEFARNYIKYRYTMRRHPHDWDNWHGEGNIGDAIQCLAVEHLFAEIGISPESLIRINRDAITEYSGSPCVLPMQGWFGYFADIFPFPWSNFITPLFIGFHLTSTGKTRNRFVEAGIHKLMKPFQPIGCRDRSTMLFLRSLGLNAYLSGCLTLTFPRRETFFENGKIFIVDLPDSLKAQLPRSILEESDDSITHFYYFNTYPVTEGDALQYENAARSILDRYRNEARLVITSRIHAALPCIGMGIPVIFISENAQNERVDVLTGLVPVYDKDSIPTINWNPEPVAVEFIQSIQKNIFYTILRGYMVSSEVAPGYFPIPTSPGTPDLNLFNIFELETDRKSLYIHSFFRKKEYDEIIKCIQQYQNKCKNLIRSIKYSYRCKIGSSIVVIFNKLKGS
jgi:hypothetical protein